MSAAVPDKAPIADPGQPGELLWVNIDDLIVNPTYQREITRVGQSLIHRIVKDFHWEKMQPVQVCAAKKQGKYYVIDGQHRVIALIERGDIDSVPVYCCRQLETAAQAEAFISINRNRVQMTRLGLHHARVGAGHEDALRVERVCKAAGVVLMRKPVSGDAMGPNETMAVGKIEALSKTLGEDAVADGIRLMIEAWPENYSLRAALIDGVCRLWCELGNPDLRSGFVLGIKGNFPEGWIALGRNHAETYSLSVKEALRAVLVRAVNAQLPRGKKIKGPA